MFVDTKENTLIIKNKKSQKERKTFRKNQIEILELRNTKPKIVYVMFQHGQLSKEREREQTVAKELLNVKKRKSSLIFMLFYAKNKGKMMAKLKTQS